MTDQGFLRYKRSRFSTKLPSQHLYTRGHLWLRSSPDDGWRIGFTRFALRMLGDLVEFDFEVEPGAQVEVGQAIGWVEGFKAVTDVFTPIAGRFCGSNPELVTDITLMQKASYDRGWVFAIDGDPGNDCVDAEGYAAFLDATIDKMMGENQ